MEKNNQYLGTEPLGKLLFKLAVPSVVAQIINMLYNIVDSFFIAKISENAMTALSLVFPMQNFINSVCIGFGIHGRRSTGLDSHGPGRQQRRRAHTRQLLYIADNNIGYTHLGAPDMG